ncbi:type II toxin-antitoxin system VapC family toxin [Paracoccus sp. MC1854]|uniref:type II toxin-antitoxin system VapC family toxin n=1 Tax=Paracoccus sp. MC1854 TaxID=2760306 RepID=UPI0015FFFFE3|nr:type II toxin-antitoxin system VapC family toxin [Paracoccus sp. MC1854]MBB1492631.1 type II toxin-antitoxin system VapC family toxin [Paracoccus sp. MC1854]
MNPPGDCVVDASVALKWVLDEEGSEAAAALLDGRRLYAPPLLLIEAANALWVACRRGAISADDAEDALHQIAAAPFRNWLRPGNLPADAFRLARLLDHPVYDCSYLALAMAIGVPVVTADRRFVQAAGRSPEAGSLVCLLGVSSSATR